MATTDDETTAQPEPESTPTKATPEAAARPGGAAQTLKRYGPFLAIAVIVVAAIAVFGSGGGDDDDDTGGDGGDDVAAGVDTDELIRSGPMTPQRAELEGRDDVDFGPDCDTDAGRIMLPTIYAPPCVVPFEGANGGATAPGVTGDEVVLVRYETDPALDPLIAAQIAATGAEVNPETSFQTVEDYVAMFQEVFETYGREVRVVPFTGSGPGDDPEAARADAIAISELNPRPFAVFGGPNRMGPIFAQELANQDIICLATCPLAVPQTIVEANQPYILPTAGTPTQNAQLAAELIGKLAGPGPAEMAGDEALRTQDRVYAVLHYDNPDGDYEEGFEDFVDYLGEYDIEPATDIRFELDLNRMAENARTYIAQLKEAGVTTVIYTGDPLMPAQLTSEATAQSYSPEWILSSSVLADTAVFARQFDQQQWVNGFGISLPAARGEEETGDSYRLYEWGYGTAPPNNTYNVLEPGLRLFFIGIHLAGENLTPETFREGLFRYPPSGGTPTAAQTSRGSHGVWPELDLGGVDDAAIIWWDADAEGVDEAGNDGVGLYRFANGGERYTLGEFPDTAEEAGLFDEANSVTIYEELPEADRTPDYEPPDL